MFGSAARCACARSATCGRSRTATSPCPCTWTEVSGRPSTLSPEHVSSPALPANDRSIQRRSTMKLYGFGPTRSTRALWGLRELDADFEFVPVNLLAGEHKNPEFLRLNPAGKVPVLVDSDLVIPESAAIVLYLADKYREKGLLPENLEARANVYRWTMFAVTELEQPLWRITKHTRLYPEDKRLPADIALAREEF